MTGLRSLAFNIALYLYTAVVSILGMPVFLASRRAAARFGARWAAGALCLLRWTVGLSHEVRGRENLPAGPCIIAMKHQSAWDTFAVTVVFSDPAIVLKKELLLIPFYGWYLWKAGMIAVDRAAGSAALKRLLRAGRRAADDGRPIVIFPEGTRTAVGAHTDYHPGVAALYRDLALPLVPVAVNSGVFWGRRAFAKHPGRIVVQILPAIPPGGDRRAVMAELRACIEGATAALVVEAQGASARG